MAFTTADLTPIEEAIKKGYLSVRDRDGRMVTYRSMDDLIRARDAINSELDAVSVGTDSRTTYAQHSRD